MCGRATLSTPAEVLADLFGLDEIPELGTRYNIAPSQPIAVVRSGTRRIALVGWAIDGHVNARADAVLARPAFREAVRGRRCLVIVDGFYEWQEKAGAPKSRAKRPFHVRRRDGRPFALAGILN